MKKENILYVVIIILLIVIIGGTTYLIIDNNKKNNEPIKEVKKTNEKKEYNLTLNNADLEWFLRYVPTVAYTSKASSLSTIKIGDLVAYVSHLLYYDFLNETQDAANIPIDKLDEYFLRMYNIKVMYKDVGNKDISEIKNELYNFDNSLCFYYKSTDQYMHGYQCGSGTNYVSYINDYEVKNDEIIIYSYEVSYLINQNKVKDLYTSNNYNIGYTNGTKEDWHLNDSFVKDYLINNKDKFTKYKHTFKRNNIGYYWYSTTIV